MSDPVRPDEAAFHELQFVVRNLVDELAGFRRRALQAEAQLRSTSRGQDDGSAPDSNGRDDGSGAGPDAAHAGRLAELERENAVLRARLDAATERTRRMLDRVRFLRQQHALPGER